MIEDQIKREEGYRSKPYYCSEGRLTVGYGRCIDTNPLSKSEIKKIVGKLVSHDNCVEWLYTHGLSEKNAEWLLHCDIGRTVSVILAKYPWMSDMDQVRFDAIVNMAYQLGVSKLGKFKHMLLALECANYEAAADEALDSRWAEQTPERANRVAEQIRTGVEM